MVVGPERFSPVSRRQRPAEDADRFGDGDEGIAVIDRHIAAGAVGADTDGGPEVRGRVHAIDAVDSDDVVERLDRRRACADNTSQLMCIWGGVITFANPGQTTEQIP